MRTYVINYIKKLKTRPHETNILRNFLPGKVAIYLVCFFVTLQSIKAADGGTLVGDKVPDFTVESLDGKTFNILEYRGKKPVYLIFWATWCPICKKELPTFKAMYKKIR